ncbi:sigma-70 family RNA polymerase sigma factor [Candidatus Wolfebacteria bacterium]|nr:sigma-70 family RNA polymerase sigma factor [Candidatus Wolfebacteria bacterium]
MIDGDKKLIHRAIRGEAEAFGLLYDRYQPQIYRFILIKVGHREEAEDLTHQVFLKSWQNISSYKFQGFPFSSWLYSVARNQVVDYYRTKKKTLVIEEITELKIEDSYLKDIDKEFDIERIKKAIFQLKDEYQDIIILRFIEDLSPKEIALIINKSEGAVKLLQHRAIKNLKKILN